MSTIYVVVRENSTTKHVPLNAYRTPWAAILRIKVLMRRAAKRKQIVDYRYYAVELDERT